MRTREEIICALANYNNFKPTHHSIESHKHVPQSKAKRNEARNKRKQAKATRRKNRARK